MTGARTQFTDDGMDDFHAAFSTSLESRRAKINLSTIARVGEVSPAFHLVNVLRAT